MDKLDDFEEIDVYIDASQVSLDEIIKIQEPVSFSEDEFVNFKNIALQHLSPSDLEDYNKYVNEYALNFIDKKNINIATDLFPFVLKFLNLGTGDHKEGIDIPKDLDELWNPNEKPLTKCNIYNPLFAHTFEIMERALGLDFKLRIIPTNSEIPYNSDLLSENPNPPRHQYLIIIGKDKSGKIYYSPFDPYQVEEGLDDSIILELQKSSKNRTVNAIISVIDVLNMLEDQKEMVRISKLFETFERNYKNPKFTAEEQFNFRRNFLNIFNIKVELLERYIQAARKYLDAYLSNPDNKITYDSRSRTLNFIKKKLKKYNG